MFILGSSFFPYNIACYISGGVYFLCSIIIIYLLNIYLYSCKQFNLFGTNKISILESAPTWCL